MKNASAFVVPCLIVIFGGLAFYNIVAGHKWRPDMPDEGTMLCSAAGQGFRVINNPFGYHVDRYVDFDRECLARMK